MTKHEARAYIDRTNWYILRRCVTGDPVPPDVVQKREEAYRVLEESE